jgi:hypothetical protein
MPLKFTPTVGQSIIHSTVRMPTVSVSVTLLVDPRASTVDSRVFLLNLGRNTLGHYPGEA